MNLKELLLIKLMEECAEVQQICSKTLRFGTEESYNCESGTNIARLEDELLDVFACIYSLSILGTIKLPQYNDPGMQSKLERIHKYMGYSKELGILE